MTSTPCPLKSLPCAKTLTPHKNLDKTLAVSPVWARLTQTKNHDGDDLWACCLSPFLLACKNSFCPFFHVQYHTDSYLACKVQEVLHGTNDIQKVLYRIVPGLHPITSSWCPPAFRVTAALVEVVLLPSEIWRS